MGLNKPLDPSLQQDYTPTLVKITFPNIVEECDDRTWEKGYKDRPVWGTGSFTIGYADDDQTPSTQFTVAKQDYSVRAEWLKGSSYFEGGLKPDYNIFGALIALKGGHTKVAFKLIIDLKLSEPPRVCRRPFRLSHAAMAGCSSMA